jgi:Rha family phage regulatory protein
MQKKSKVLYNEYYREYYKANKEKIKANHAKYWAKKAEQLKNQCNIPFEIIEDDTNEGENTMTELTVIKKDDVFVVDSRDVAVMVDKPHNDLMKSIRTYIEYLGQGTLSHSNFFIESTYLNSQNKEQPCYLLTKKGCDMVANKMTGEKGVLFTATYVSKFEEMESKIKQNTYLDATNLPKELQMFSQLFNSVAQAHITATQVQLENKALTQKVQSVTQEFTEVKTLLTDREENWRAYTKRLIDETIARVEGDYLEYARLRDKSYRMLEERGKCNLSTRVKNMKIEANQAGAPKSKVDKINNLDAIDLEPRLQEIYISIVKELSISWTK